MHVSGSLARWIVTATTLCLAAPLQAAGQQAAQRRDSIQDTTQTKRRKPILTAGESDGEGPRRQLIPYNQIDLGFTTVHFGAGLLIDGIAYSQNLKSELQFPDLRSEMRLRDARFLANGTINTKRGFTWQLGIMYDQTLEDWVFRQSGLMLAVPEIGSHFFLGRAKEGFSLNKVMVGYDGWSMERAPISDATIPLLADGIKWLGSIKDNHYFWNLGLFTDTWSEGQTFSSYDYQGVLRAGWLPYVSDSAGTLLHLGMNFRAGNTNDGILRLRSKPEAFPAPFFIDTGIFPAESAREFGPEIYFRPGRFLIGGEYYWQHVTSRQTGDPAFEGGDIIVAWLTTGETRSYNTVGHYFRGVSPKSTVIQGGPGAWEVVLKYSYTDLNGDSIQGGRFTRFTPMLNWHMTDNVRLEFAYGYGVLNRFGLKGKTQFFQTRLQMRL